MIRNYLFIFFCLFIFPSSLYSSEFWTTQTWLDSLYYKKSGSQYYSLAKTPNFFITKTGPSNPKIEYEESLKNVDDSIKNYKAELDIILGNAFLLKGLIHDILGERKIALAAYEEVIKLDNHSSAIRKAKIFKKTPHTI